MITKNISSMFQKCAPWSSLMIGEMHCSYTSSLCSVHAVGKSECILQDRMMIDKHFSGSSRVMIWRSNECMSNKSETCLPVHHKMVIPC